MTPAFIRLERDAPQSVRTSLSMHAPSTKLMSILGKRHAGTNTSSLLVVYAFRWPQRKHKGNRGHLGQPTVLSQLLSSLGADGSKHRLRFRFRWGCLFSFAAWRHSVTVWFSCVAFGSEQEEGDANTLERNCNHKKNHHPMATLRRTTAKGERCNIPRSELGEYKTLALDM